MKTVKIRDISAKVIEAAAETQEPLAITSDNVVCGIVIPVSPQWVQEVVHYNLARIANSIQKGEKELVCVEPLTTLDDALGEMAETPATPPLRRVSIREISSKLIAAAAERNESLAITSDRVMRGVLIPVSQRWLQEIVDFNLSRVVRSIQLGEREIALDQPFVTLDEVLAEPAAEADTSVEAGPKDVRPAEPPARPKPPAARTRAAAAVRLKPPPEPARPKPPAARTRAAAAAARLKPPPGASPARAGTSPASRRRRRSQSARRGRDDRRPEAFSLVR